MASLGSLQGIRWLIPFLHSKSSGADFILAKPKDSGLSTSCQKPVWNLWAYRALFIALTVAEK